MSQSPSGSGTGRDMKSRFNAFIRSRFWKMDIHPTAQIAGSALIDRTWPAGIHIGANCIVDEEATVLTHDMTRGLYLDTRLEEGAYIGPRAVILPGITIGRNAQVMAGAVVNKDVAEGMRVIGNPARPVEQDASAS